MKRSERVANNKYHYIYKTTCLTTGKFYIGMHSTNDLNDGYMGSGKKLWQSINKHGLENHRCDILEQLPSRAALRAREAELVNEELLHDPMCMNLMLGGHGGWETANSKQTSDYRSKRWTEPDFRAAVQRGLKTTWAKIHDRRVKQMQLPEYKQKQSLAWTDERKQAHGQLMSDKYTGASNPSAGKPWVYHPELKQCKKIQAEELETYLAEGWLKGRKMKFGS